MSGTEAVRIGVTGHRRLAEVDRVVSAIDEALTCIERQFPRRALVVISSLAEGADRLVVHRVLARYGAKFVALLPLPARDYEQDFTSSQSKAEFQALLSAAGEVIELPPALTREAAYDAAGPLLLSRSDVLVAIWDGQHAQDRGGTAAIVEEARHKGIPLAWVHAGNRKPGTLEPTTLGPEQGQLTFERFRPPGA